MAKLYFYYSTMNAGKSTLLLQSSYNYIERGMDTILITPAVDTRYGLGKIQSRIGLNANATPVDTDVDLFELVKDKLSQSTKIKCVLVDESQFLTRDQVSQLADIPDHFNIPVLAYGLRTDFQGELFEGSHYLMAWADELIEIKTICHCGRKATMVLRIDEFDNPIRTGSQIEIGGNNRYVATCRKHFRLGQPKNRDHI
ncbi:MAG: thymidine kinase [Gammaproteobacteria bacterium]